VCYRIRIRVYVQLFCFYRTRFSTWGVYCQQVHPWTDRRQVRCHGASKTYPPAGARAWSVWPRRYPVRRRSRSITASTRQSPVCGPLCHSHAASAIVRSQCARKSQLSTMRYVSLNSRISHTLSVPLVHRVPGPLAAVLHVPDLRETGTRNAEELWLY
jgi:hypothetical protein